MKKDDLDKMVIMMLVIGLFFGFVIGLGYGLSHPEKPTEEPTSISEVMERESNETDYTRYCKE